MGMARMVEGGMSTLMDPGYELQAQGEGGLEEPLVEVTQRRENLGLVVQDGSGMARPDGDTGCEDERVVVVNPLKYGVRVRLVLVKGINRVILLKGVMVVRCMKGIRKLRISDSASSSEVMPREADMVVELTNVKGRRWKRRARERLDEDSVMAPDGVSGKQTGSDLSEEVVAPEKIRRTDTEIKVFLWCASLNWIPTLVNLEAKRVPMEAYCPLCRKEAKTTLHALWGCSLLKPLRKSNSRWAVCAGKVGMSFLDIIVAAKARLKLEDFVLLCVVMWHAWFRLAKDYHALKEGEASLLALTSFKPAWIREVEDSYYMDLKAATVILKLLIGSQVIQDFTFKDGILRKDGVIYVGSYGNFRRKLAEEVHSSVMGGHSGVKGKVAYCLLLPPGAQIHPVFHVSQLKAQIGDRIAPNPQLLHAGLDEQLLMQPVAILDRKLIKRNNKGEVQYLVQWSTTSLEDATWEDAEMIRRSFLSFDP
ncbi:hypothetical protein JRO89_XS04G0178700 [Xanthoceras sorbifolium]|uniref:Chromo domain-containing protein n=1 Tax=Xanthoceras sorbifolium TaxID=99658 RepID=A0ABQ8I5R4_9ROSI|nr:hypothetical protein JRO89_XS04G0178700 [Xanthoceras sorbifolium]